MRGKQTVIINGRQFDAATGKPIEPATGVKPIPVIKGRFMDVKNVKTTLPIAKPGNNRLTAPIAHSKVHRKVEHSHTLNRKATKRPTVNSSSRSPMIQRFAAHPKPLHTIAVPIASAAPNPITQHHNSVTHIHKPAEATPSAKAFKEHLIRQQLDQPVQKGRHLTRHKEHKVRSMLARQPRALHIAAACLAVVVLGGYFTYLNMPSLSVSVAAARAGEAASFPQYKPDGYHFSGPVAYEPGAVTINFDSNTSDSDYKVIQRSTNWDSLAVLNNYVLPSSKNYQTTSSEGLTIYTFKGQAAWVNGGILYTIQGDAPLSNAQVLHIAGSL